MTRRRDIDWKDLDEYTRDIRDEGYDPTGYYSIRVSDEYYHIYAPTARKAVERLLEITIYPEDIEVEGWGE